MTPHYVTGSDASLGKFRHDLRTPINHIIGYTEILLEEEFSRPFEPLLRGIAAHSRETLTVIQKLLPAQHVSAEAAGPQPAFRWDVLLQTLRSGVAPHLDQIDDFLQRAKGEAPPNAIADLERIDNAVKRLRAVISSAMVEGPKEPGKPRSASDGEQEPGSVDQRSASGTILVVDDNDLNRDMLSRQLIRQNHQVETAASGEEAIEMLRRKPYDLLLLDVLMPGLNGFEVLEKVKSDPTLRRVAVIVVSALDEVDSAIRCIELGAEDYLFKPVNPTLLRARVRSLLERTRAEEALQRRQRFESIGMLAAGVAHDFNNLLTGMIGNAHLLTQILPQSEDREMAESIVQSGERAAELIQQLLAYAGKSASYVRPLDLSALIHETERLIRASLPSQAEFRLQLSVVPKINADANQLKQALLNLTINAAEALAQERSNCVVIETGTENISAHERFDLGPEDVVPGEYVYLEVRDNGCGIDSEAMPKIFEPFYSTKFLGRGLGLAAVAGIVRTHGGMMRVSSTKGTGSSFRVFFPALAATSRGAVADRAEPAILVIDDEHVIRQIARVAIERSGHKALLAETGSQGIELFANPENNVGVVLLDLRMPEMSGDEVLRRLEAIRPGVKVIVSSGLPQSEVEGQLRNRPVAAILQKPYKMTELVRTVERCLSELKNR